MMMGCDIVSVFILGINDVVDIFFFRWFIFNYF